VAAVAAGLFKMLAPSGSNEKLLKMLAGVFMLSVIVTPFLGGIHLEIPETAARAADLSSLEQEVQNHLAETADAAAKKRIGELLRKNGIQNAKIIISMSTDKDKRISIEQVDIYINREDKGLTNAAGAAIKQEFEVTAGFYEVSG
jgi:hypothetical protein